LVLDASALVELLLATEVGTRVDQRVRAARVVMAPAHIDAEALSAVGRLVRAELVDPEVAADAIEDLADMPLTRVPLPGLLVSAWLLRSNIALRDALYVALAEHVEGTLLTCDAKLVRALEQHPVKALTA
jgi:predicted nucleic acid-binding protein